MAFEGFRQSNAALEKGEGFRDQAKKSSLLFPRQRYECKTQQRLSRGIDRGNDRGKNGGVSGSLQGMTVHAEEGAPASLRKAGFCQYYYSVSHPPPPSSSQTRPPPPPPPPFSEDPERPSFPSADPSLRLTDKPEAKTRPRTSAARRNTTSGGRTKTGEASRTRSGERDRPARCPQKEEMMD
ncbi:uncharacterized protein PHA67_023147 [Liasis olivaceus]